MSPNRWVTLREVYRSTLDPERIERKIAEVEALVEPPGSPSTRSCAPASSRASASSSRSSTCPTSPRRSARRSRQVRASQQASSPADPPTPPCSPAAVARRLPPLDQVIDEGKVLALNMSAGIDRGWGTDLAETRPSTPVPAGRRRTASVRGCRCGRGHDPGRRLRCRVWTASMPASAAMGPAGLDARLTLVRNPQGHLVRVAALR